MNEQQHKKCAAQDDRTGGDDDDDDDDALFGVRPPEAVARVPRACIRMTARKGERLRSIECGRAGGCV